MRKHIPGTNIVDIIGNRYGMFVVSKFLGRNRDGHNLWECRCDCGNKVVVSYNALRAGYQDNCGCLMTKTGRVDGNMYMMADMVIYRGKDDAANGLHDDVEVSEKPLQDTFVFDARRLNAVQLFELEKIARQIFQRSGDKRLLSQIREIHKCFELKGQVALWWCDAFTRAGCEDEEVTGFLRNIPSYNESNCMYIRYIAEQGVFYVGRATNLFKRYTDKTLLAEVIWYHNCDSLEEADKLETDTIRFCVQHGIKLGNMFKTRDSIHKRVRKSE